MKNMDAITRTHNQKIINQSKPPAANPMQAQMQLQAEIAMSVAGKLPRNGNSLQGHKPAPGGGGGGGGALTFEKGRGVRPQNLKPYP